MQPAIFIATIVIFFVTGRQPIVALVFFIMMQLGALAGAAWGARLKRKIEDAQDQLPLHRRQD
jgi:uncharacterized membrane protein YfcA